VDASDCFTVYERKSAKKFKSDFATGDDVLSCLKSVITDKQARSNSLYQQALASQDGSEPDVTLEYFEDSEAQLESVSLIDSSCETWLNLRKLQEVQERQTRSRDSFTKGCDVKNLQGLGHTQKVEGNLQWRETFVQQKPTNSSLFDTSHSITRSCASDDVSNLNLD